MVTIIQTEVDRILWIQRGNNFNHTYNTLAEPSRYISTRHTPKPTLHNAKFSLQHNATWLNPNTKSISESHSPPTTKSKCTGSMACLCIKSSDSFTSATTFYTQSTGTCVHISQCRSNLVHTLSTNSSATLAVWAKK